MNGEVIGINQAIYTQNKGGSIGIGFAIPIDDVKRAHEDTEKFGRRAPPGWLGVTIQPGHGADGGFASASARTMAAARHRQRPGSPAAAAG